MPIYEYRCTACEECTEFLQKFDSKPMTECPECGKPALEKLVSASSFHLKGTGWYVTDFKDNDKKKAEDKKATEKKATEKKAEKLAAKSSEPPPKKKKDTPKPKNV
jgi:putative FmdB family regulatory protein